MGMEAFSFRKKDEGRLNTQPYSLSFKRQVIEQYLRGGVSLRQLGLQYGLNKGLIGYWVKIYKFGRPSGLKRRVNKFMVLDNKQSSDLSPAEQIALLKKQLADAQLKNLALETMITVAEKQFNIPIRKKSGTKQSR